MPSGVAALPAFCFSTLLEKLGATASSTKAIPIPGSTPLDLYLKVSKTPTSLVDPHKEYPLFVTWEKFSKRSGDYDLRGCIGTFSARSILSEELKKYALIAGFRDHRFSPIGVSEIPKLSCSVTLLDNFEIADGPLDWELGKHGIIIEFEVGSRHYDATFLPDVPVDQGWDKEETLAHLIRKSGAYNVHSYKDIPGLQLTRYTGEKSTMTWEDYVGYTQENAEKLGA